jgi:hypothetical protein
MNVPQNTHGGIKVNIRLKGKLTEKGVTGKQLAELWDININSVYAKLNGNTIITCEELKKAALAFKLSEAEVLYILFGPNN